MQLPPPLREQIEKVVEGVSGTALQAAYRDLSERYRRAEATATTLQISNAIEAKAYLCGRLPATFCAASQVFNHFSQAYPDYSPATVLDIGTGPGSTALAVTQHFAGAQPQLCLVEPNLHLGQLAESLTGQTVIQSNLEAFNPDKQFDLITLGYVLNEIPSARLQDILTKLWQATSHSLILIEPGTPYGFSTLHACRDILLQLGAEIAAPCPHSLSCPLFSMQRWCHFSVRVDRSALHRRIKPDASLNYEDEKFSYLIASKYAPADRPVHRLLGQPHGTKVLELELCNQDGRFSTERFSKSHPDYKTLRKLNWGDAFDDSQ